MEPCDQLKEIQKRIAVKLLGRFHHEACHGFVEGRSIITNAEAHLESTHLLALDLTDAFGSVYKSRVHSALWGWSVSDEMVIGWRLAELLTQLCTVHWVLPQGAPSSPAIFNLVCYKMDIRLSLFAAKLGAVYTRYADNLAFSIQRPFNDLEVRTIIRIVEDRCDFRINGRKTRLMKVTPDSGGLQLPGVRLREGNKGLSKRKRRQFRGALTKSLREGEVWKVWGLLSYLRQIYGAEIPAQIIGRNDISKKAVWDWYHLLEFRSVYGEGYQPRLRISTTEGNYRLK
jgi:hypothetical protein